MNHGTAYHLSIMFICLLSQNFRNYGLDMQLTENKQKHNLECWAVDPSYVVEGKL